MGVIGLLAQASVRFFSVDLFISSMTEGHKRKCFTRLKSFFSEGITPSFKSYVMAETYLQYKEERKDDFSIL